MTTAPDRPRYTVVAVVDVQPDGAVALQRYEDQVLLLLGRHGGLLERRLRTPEDATEVHVLSFPSEGAYRAFRTDPERSRHRPLLDGVDVVHRVVESLSDVRRATPACGS
ncbi:hypothetical protein [Blastococcus brunescens]|uniref:DUF1330 domain-containing protein n=1 Tax=Blastococcus brunescens TaxID=1564165 RepID=A0ABZ1AZE2_9ACTN|nr:hypothetical protein [Blastococcus sp. BMG 8361]WRL63018.1 hypothetical protein U6N30_24695 [Blastococcus sp. BMG 8361]